MFSVSIQGGGGSMLKKIISKVFVFLFSCLLCAAPVTLVVFYGSFKFDLPNWTICTKEWYPYNYTITNQNKFNLLSVSGPQSPTLWRRKKRIYFDTFSYLQTSQESLMLSSDTLDNCQVTMIAIPTARTKSADRMSRDFSLPAKEMHSSFQTEKVKSRLFAICKLYT